MSEAWKQWEGHVVNSKFQLKKFLGGSEQSAVFLTEDPERDLQPVAIKLIDEPENADLHLARWGLAQGLSHPHLIRILRTGRSSLGAREVIFALMEYAEENLAQILPERPLTPQEAREMLQPALDALAYVHRQGFVHGRLKPANVLAANDQLKLSSDGLCRSGEKLSAQHTPGSYDPPELAGGGTSPAADVWALGMTLAEVLTQRLPACSEKDQTDPALPVNLPAPFLEIVRGCLRRDPQLRLTIAAIGVLLYGGPSKPSTRPPQPPARVPEARPPSQMPSMTRSRGTAWVWRSAFPVAFAVLGIAALLAGFGFLRHQQEIQPDAAAVKPEPSLQPAKPDAGTRSPKATPARQSNAAGSRLDSTPAPAMKPQQASLRSQVQTSSSNPSPGVGARDSQIAISGVQQVLPDVPQSASETIQGTIRVSVRVNVDPSGRVVGADIDSPGPSRYFARLSLEAAQKWKFPPSSQDTGRDFFAHFEFRNSGTRTYATR